MPVHSYRRMFGLPRLSRKYLSFIRWSLFLLDVFALIYYSIILVIMAQMISWVILSIISKFKLYQVNFKQGDRYIFEISILEAIKVTHLFGLFGSLLLNYPILVIYANMNMVICVASTWLWLTYPSPVFPVSVAIHALTECLAIILAVGLRLSSRQKPFPFATTFENPRYVRVSRRAQHSMSFPQFY